MHSLEEMDSCLSEWYLYKVKRKQPCPGFELGVLSSFLMIAVMENIAISHVVYDFTVEMN